MKRLFVSMIATIVFITVIGALSRQFVNRNFAKETSVCDTTNTPSGLATKYESICEKAINIGNSSQKLIISQNENDVTDTNITLNGKKVMLKRVAIGAGYAHPDIKLADVTGDGRKEIVMFLEGGASGVSCDIQIFGKTNGEWSEISTPDSLWEDNDVSISADREENLVVEVSAVDFRQQVCSKQDVPGKKLEGIVGIRKCKIENGKIQIGDDISIGTVGNKIGEVVQTLKYDKKNNQFIYDKIKYKSTN